MLFLYINKTFLKEIHGTNWTFITECKIVLFEISQKTYNLPPYNLRLPPLRIFKANQSYMSFCFLHAANIGNLVCFSKGICS